VAAALPPLLIFVWLHRFQITIVDDHFRYSSLFGGVRCLRWGEIEKAETKIDTSAKLGPIYKLILWPEPVSGDKPIVINMKVFGKADLSRAFEFLGPKLQSKSNFSIFQRD